jgi:hypothetical protein
MIVRLVAAANLFAIGLAASLLSAAPATAATPEEKLATCGWGADAAELTGVKRKAYMAKCTADKDSPRGKTETARSAAKPASAKPAAAKPAMPRPNPQ